MGRFLTTLMEIPSRNSNEQAFSVQGEEVFVRSFLSPDEIAGLSFNESMPKYARYRPLIQDKNVLIKAASGPDANVTLAITPERRIVGAGILQYPSPEERWNEVGDRLVMEVSAVEVSGPWRSQGLSRNILRLLMDHPLKEERIFYMVGFSWTWDIDGKGITAMAYRNMLIKIFGGEGFRIYQTNEPNVMLRPENLFMARIGGGISEAVRRRFKWVRFGLDMHLDEL
jgi:acetoin utilization protein AcuA